MAISLKDLEKLLDEAQGAEYCEIRYQSRRVNELRVVKGGLEEARASFYRGVGIRVLFEGSWGFTSTSEVDVQKLKEAVKDALAMAKASSLKKAERSRLGGAKLARGTYEVKATDLLEDHGIEEKLRLVKDTEALIRSSSSVIKSASCSYSENIDHKLIVNTDGASVELKHPRPEFKVMAVASEEGKSVSASESTAVTGGWTELFRKKGPEEMANSAAEKAKKLLRARQPKGERAKVILDPGMVGMIAHEAIGHTVEADFVLSGSIAKNRIGEKVASELLTLVDSGLSEIESGAAGTILVDDEGVVAGKTVIVDQGTLASYLHNRETAAIFNVESTGNARAFEYSDEPIIRMRNTYVEPRDFSLEEMIKDVRHGYLLKGPRSGQADANGEFMFGAQEAYLIEGGEVKELLRGVTISGRAFDVLKSVDAISKDFSYELGAGYCGKRQPAKVDGGGPYIRCEAIVGGTQ